MRTANIHEAQTHLSRLVEAAVRGEYFVIAKARKPMVRVVPIGEPARPPQKRIGFAPTKYSVPDDFGTMMQDEIIALFEEGEIEPKA